jgi:hypothetical protein
MWASAAFGLLTGGVWTVSGWYDVGYAYAPNPGFVVAGADRGGGYIAWGSDPNIVRRLPANPGWHARPHPARWAGGWEFRMDPGLSGVAVPLWAPVLAALAVAGLCFSLSRRPIPGLCPRCGYDRSGVPAGVCPECGAAPAP